MSYRSEVFLTKKKKGNYIIFEVGTVSKSDC